MNTKPTCCPHNGAVLLCVGPPLDRPRLTPAEARALAAELEEAAWQCEQNEATEKSIKALEKLP